MIEFPLDKGPLPLWPTPWYLRIFGYPAWRTKIRVPVYLAFYSHAVTSKYKWTYVSKEE